ncbi:MAG: transposon-encoded TnpW family protein [Ethanoligenens sp.]
MSNEKIVDINAADNAAPLPTREDERPALVKKIGKTTYQVKIHFSITSRETMSDKIKRMLRNDINQI